MLRNQSRSISIILRVQRHQTSFLRAVRKGSKFLAILTHAFQSLTLFPRHEPAPNRQLCQKIINHLLYSINPQFYQLTVIINNYKQFRQMISQRCFLLKIHSTRVFFSNSKYKLQFLKRSTFLPDILSAGQFSETAQEESSHDYETRDVGRELQKISSALCQKQKNFIVLRNYLLPARPKKIPTLVDFLRTRPQYSKLTRGQVEVMEKKFTISEVSMHRKNMKIQNQDIQRQRRSYDKVYQLIKLLPFYYHILLTLIDKTTIVRSPEHMYTSQELYQKLNRVHPYLRSQAYAKYEKIHSLEGYSPIPYENLSAFRKSADRLPILYIKHPYQIFLIDQVLQSKMQLASEYYFSAHEEQYGGLFSQLPLDMQSLYNYKMQKMLLAHQSRIFEIGKKRGLEIQKIYKMMGLQFDSESQRILNEIKIK